MPVPPIHAGQERSWSAAVTDDNGPVGPAHVLRAVVEPLRRAVLAQAAEGPVSIEEIASRTGASKREIAEAIGYLRTTGLIDEAGRTDQSVFRNVAMALPSEQPEVIDGPWTASEAEILRRFFDGDRLRSVPSNIAKRRLVLEKVALRFEPGVRYHERDVNFTIQLIYADYAAIRRYLIDEGFMDRADGAYWRIGGRDAIPPDTPKPLTIPTDLDGVVLRTYDLSMASDLVGVANDPRIARYMADRFPNPYTDDDAYQWITYASSQDPAMNFAVVAEGQIVGGVGATELDGERTGSYEIGWWLTPTQWGNGITSTAARALLRYVFVELGAMHVFAPVMKPNGASAAVARNIGLRMTGVDPQAYLKGGVRYDQVNFALTRSDWSR